MVYSFKVYLKDRRSKRTENFRVESVKDDYLSAWRDAVEQALEELKDYDPYWYIAKIEDVGNKKLKDGGR